LVYGIEVILLLECEMPSLKLAIKLILDRIELKKRLIYLEKLDETHIDVITTNEVHKR
jgi:hypothetical protein